MKTLKQNMTMSFNSRRGHAGTIWEGRFYDKRSNPTVEDMNRGNRVRLECHSRLPQ